MSFEITTIGPLCDGQRSVEVDGEDTPFSVTFLVGPKDTANVDAFCKRCKGETGFDLSEPEEDFEKMLFDAVQDGILEAELTPEYVEQLKNIK